MVPTNTRSSSGTRLIIANWSAHSIQAVTSLVIGTVLVVLAQSGHTRNQWVTLGTRWTNTVGTVSLSETFGSPTTLCCTIRARVQALFVVARLVVRAVVVVLAFRLVTLDLWIASPSLRAHAQRTVRQRAALGISGAWITLGTRILALLVDAGPVAGALRIHRTLRRDHRLAVAVLEWISHHTDWAGADRLVTLGQTLGSARARIELRARIHTSAVSARLRCGTLDIRTASRLNW